MPVSKHATQLRRVSHFLMRSRILSLHSSCDPAFPHFFLHAVPAFPNPSVVPRSPTSVVRRDDMWSDI